MPRSKHTVLKKLAILDELSQSKTGLGPVANRHGIDYKTLERWRDRYSRDGINGLKEAKKNKHYSKELKLKVVHTYLIGEGTFDELANKFGLRGLRQVVDWVNKYNGNKLLTATPSRKLVPTMSRNTTLEERIEIVEYVTKLKYSYTEAAEHFQVSYQQARSWVIKAKHGGYETLVDNRGQADQYIVLATTMTTLRSEAIIPMYGRRWQIECYFKVAKQYLQFDQTQVQSYDRFCGHLAMLNEVEIRNIPFHNRLTSIATVYFDAFNL